MKVEYSSKKNYCLQKAHPVIKRVHWTDQETQKFLQLIIKFGKNWKLISEKLKNRSPRQCLQKYHSQQRVKDKASWSIKEEIILADWGKLYGAGNWDKCTELLKTKTLSQCLARWIKFFQNNRKKGKWSDHEQFDLFQKLKNDWDPFSKQFPSTNRNQISIKNFIFFSIKKIKNSPLSEFLGYIMFKGCFFLPL